MKPFFKPKVSYADLSDELRNAVSNFSAFSFKDSDYFDNDIWGMAWLEAMGPQEFLEMMEES